MTARWIARRAREERKTAVEAELRATAPRTGRELLDSLVEVYSPTHQAQQRAQRLNLPDPPPRPSVEAELARLADGKPQHWTSPLRDELLAEFLIEKTTREDGRWNGDQITEKGLRRLAQLTRSR